MSRPAGESHPRYDYPGCLVVSGDDGEGGGGHVLVIPVGAVRDAIDVNHSGGGIRAAILDQGDLVAVIGYSLVAVRATLPARSPSAVST